MKIIIKDFKFLHYFFKFFRIIQQNSNSEMMSSFSLAKSTSRNKNNSSFLQTATTIIKIWYNSLLFSILNSFLWKFYSRKRIHCTFDFICAQVITLPKVLSNYFCTFLQRSEEFASFSFIFLDCFFRVSFKDCRAIDHKINCDLSHSIWANFYWFNIFKFLKRFFFNIDKFNISSS